MEQGHPRRQGEGGVADDGGSIGLARWEMEGGAFVVNHNLPQVSTNFQIAGTEDFDSDGDADIVWRHDEGLLVTWEIETNAIAQVQNFGVVPNAWQIQGTEAIIRPRHCAEGATPTLFSQ